MMHTVRLKKVTIIAEAVLEPQIVRAVRELGASGYTISEARGEGSRGVRASEWEGRNVMVETLVGPETADRILAHVSETYFEHYAVVAYVADVEVVRGAKYLTSEKE
jgi:nitrogen regulatory protein P-II 2